MGVVDTLKTMPKLKSLQINLHEEEQVDYLLRTLTDLQLLNGLAVEREALFNEDEEGEEEAEEDTPYSNEAPVPAQPEAVEAVAQQYYEAQNPQMTVVEEAQAENEESAIYQRHHSDNKGKELSEANKSNISKLQPEIVEHDKLVVHNQSQLETEEEPEEDNQDN